MNKIIVIMLLVLAPVALFAHGMKVTVEAGDDGSVTGTAMYAADSPVVGAKVTVTNSKGEKVFKGKTGEDGTFSFTIECRDNYKIKVRHGGHQGKTTLNKADLPESLPEC